HRVAAEEDARLDGRRQEDGQHGGRRQADPHLGDQHLAVPPQRQHAGIERPPQPRDHSPPPRRRPPRSSLRRPPYRPPSYCKGFSRKNRRALTKILRSIPHHRATPALPKVTMGETLAARPTREGGRASTKERSMSDLCGARIQ